MEHSQQMNHVFGRLFNDPNTTDWEIHSRHGVYYVHGAIMKARSPWFAAMMQEEVTRDKRGKIVIEDADPKILRAMLYGMYNGRHEACYHDLHSLEIYNVLEYEAEALRLNERLTVAGVEEACVDHLEHAFARCPREADDYDHSTIANLFSVFYSLGDLELQSRLLGTFDSVVPMLIEILPPEQLDKHPSFLRMVLERRAPTAAESLHLVCPRCTNEVWFTNKHEDSGWKWGQGSKLQCPGCKEPWNLFDEAMAANKAMKLF